MRTTCHRIDPTLCRVAAALLVAAVVLFPASSPGQSVGLYFDPDRIDCTGEVAPFGMVRVYVVAQTPPGQVTTGILLSLQAPPNLEIVGMDPEGLIFDPHNFPTVSGSLAGGLDLQFYPCFPPDTVVTLFKFDLFDRSDTPRSNLRLHFVGANPDSMSAPLRPQFKLCDPDDPNGNLGFVDAVAHDAYLNCSGTCICTVTIEPASWSSIKHLYTNP